MDSENINFDISRDVLELGLNGTYLIMTNLSNRESDERFEKLKDSIINDFKERFNREFINSNHILEGFRSLHTLVQRSNKKYISSAENLLLYMIEHGTVPHINLVVDIYNLVSIKSLLALGAHDISKIDGNVHLKLTNGSECFWPIGSQKQKPVSSGEYSYIDDNNDIICRLEVRQVEKTKVLETTKDCFYIIQGNRNTPASYINNTADELVSITKEFCGGNCKYLYKAQ